MELYRVGQHRWEVLVTEEVLQFLQDTPNNASDAMLSLLMEYVPRNGPPRNEEISKAVGDGLFEFRKQPKGPKLRVLYFYDNNRVIVCVNAFEKKQQKLPSQERAIALSVRDEYFRAKELGTLRIAPLM